MSNFNKLITNKQVSLNDEEVANLSETLSAVRTQGGGSGGSYGGDGIDIVITGNNTIALKPETHNRIWNNDYITSQEFDNTISSYATKTYVNTTFQTKDSMSAYLTSSNAAITYQTKSDMSAYWTSAETTEVFAEELSTLVGLIDSKQSKLTFSYDNDKISAINGSALAGQGGVTGDYYSASNPSGFINSAQAETQILAKNYITSGVGELANFYSKTDTSSRTELQTKFDSLLDYNVTAAAGIQVITATDLGIKTFGISMTAQPVVTDTRLSGYNGVAAALDTNVSGLWNVGLTQDMLNTINGKLDTTVAEQTYQPIGNYLSSNALVGYATQLWVEQQGYITTIPSEYITEQELAGYNYATTSLLDTISSKIESDIPTDLFTKASADTLYQTKGDYVKNTDIGLDANKVTAISGKELIITAHQSLTNYYTKDETSGATQLAQAFANLPGGGITEVSHDTTLTGKGNSTQNLGVAWSALSSNTIDYSNSAFNLTNGTSVSSFDQISAAIDDRYSKGASNNRFLQKSLDNTLTGDGTNDKKLGVAWSALSANTINSANSAGEAKGFRWSDNSYQDTSAALTNLWNSKNHVTLQSTNNILTVDNNDNTSATLSAMSYVVNPNNAYWKPQRSCVCTEAEITTMAGYANGQGMLFFVVSGHSNS